MRSGYTLPVFATAAALAALKWLKGETEPISQVSLDLINPSEIVQIPVEQIAFLKPGITLAITRSDPGDNLDLTKNTPLWAMVEFDRESDSNPPPYEKLSPAIWLKGGEGIGYDQNQGKSAIYQYAKDLLSHNLTSLLSPGEKIIVTLILPQGKQLALRTENEAFGIVEGLSLLGTSGISQPLSAPEQLEIYRQELQAKSRQFSHLIFCIGENGLSFARQLGMNPQQLIKTANWLGPLLVEAGLQGVQSILLLGHHGKLIKLAGGIFHTHHYLADGRQEIFTAMGVKARLPIKICRQILQTPTADHIFKDLENLDHQEGTNWVTLLYHEIAEAIDQRTCEYIFTQSESRVKVGSILFSRGQINPPEKSQRKIIIKSKNAQEILDNHWLQ